MNGGTPRLLVRGVYSLRDAVRLQVGGWRVPPVESHPIVGVGKKKNVTKRVFFYRFVELFNCGSIGEYYL